MAHLPTGPLAALLPPLANRCTLPNRPLSMQSVQLSQNANQCANHLGVGKGGAQGDSGQRVVAWVRNTQPVRYLTTKKQLTGSRSSRMCLLRNRPVYAHRFSLLTSPEVGLAAGSRARQAAASGATAGGAAVSRWCRRGWRPGGGRGAAARPAPCCSSRRQAAAGAHADARNQMAQGSAGLKRNVRGEPLANWCLT